MILTKCFPTEKPEGHCVEDVSEALILLADSQIQYDVNTGSTFIDT